MEPSIHSYSVLAVDDEPFALKIAKTVLHRYGFASVALAQTAEEAKRQIQVTDPPVKLVLVDLNMPGSDGLEFLRHLADQQFSGSVIVVSGERRETLSMSEKLGQARGLAVIGSIEKPLSADAFARILAHPSPPSAAKNSSHEAFLITPQSLERAISQREIEAWYQPKVNTITGAVEGVEALARWRHPQHGFVKPDQFIAVAEEHRLIDPLTFYLVDVVLSASAAWTREGHDLKAAINVSMDSLSNLNFADQLVEKLHKANMDGSNVQLEVTETRLMEDLARPLEVLLRLHLNKVSLSIDDFGTSHSNLSQLRDLPFDELKLDRSYVQGALENSRVRAILESTIEMARKLNLTMVAEGVETSSEWSLVRQLGCHQAQGYYLAKPMPLSELLSWLRRWPEQRASVI